MNQGPTEETQSPASHRRFRLWHLLALVTVSAVIFGLFRVPGRPRSLGFAILALGPAAWLAIVWDRHVKRSVQSKPPTIDAFSQFCVMFFCILIPLGIYWMVLVIVLFLLDQG